MWHVMLCYAMLCYDIQYFIWCLVDEWWYDVTWFDIWIEELFGYLLVAFCRLLLMIMSTYLKFWLTHWGGTIYLDDYILRYIFSVLDSLSPVYAILGCTCMFIMIKYVWLHCRPGHVMRILPLDPIRRPSSRNERIWYMLLMKVMIELSVWCNEWLAWYLAYD